MYGFYQDGRYSETQIRRNRRFIIAPTFLLAFTGCVFAVFGRYGLDNLAALIALLMIFSSSMWWATGTKASGPAKIDPNTIDYFKRLVKERPKDL